MVRTTYRETGARKIPSLPVVGKVERGEVSEFGGAGVPLEASTVFLTLTIAPLAGASTGHRTSARALAVQRPRFVPSVEGPSLAWDDVLRIRSDSRILVECYAHTAT